jgi:hypothetical protein
LPLGQVGANRLETTAAALIRRFVALVDRGGHPSGRRPVSGEQLDHALLGERMLGDVDLEFPIAIASPFVAQSVREGNGADMIGASQRNADRRVEVAYEVTRRAPQLAEDRLSERKRRTMMLGAQYENCEERPLAGDEHVHRVTEGVPIEEGVL